MRENSCVPAKTEETASDVSDVQKFPPLGRCAHSQGHMGACTFHRKCGGRLAPVRFFYFESQSPPAGQLERTLSSFSSALLYSTSLFHR